MSCTGARNCGQWAILPVFGRGEHLAVLRLNNLVRSRRAGRVVLYERTPRGAGLLHDDSVLP